MRDSTNPLTACPRRVMMVKDENAGAARSGVMFRILARMLYVPNAKVGAMVVDRYAFSPTVSCSI
jgi:hypothetical protein